MLDYALLAGFLLLSLLLASYLVGISLVLMTSVKFSLLLDPQHSLSGIADAICAIHIRDCLCLHEPESLNDFIVLLEFLNEVLQFIKRLFRAKRHVTKTRHESVHWDYSHNRFRVTEILLNQQL